MLCKYILCFLTTVNVFFVFYIIISHDRKTLKVLEKGRGVCIYHQLFRGAGGIPHFSRTNIYIFVIGRVQKRGLGFLRNLIDSKVLLTLIVPKYSATLSPVIAVIKGQTKKQMIMFCKKTNLD